MNSYHRSLTLPRKLNSRLKAQQQEKQKQQNQKKFLATHLFDTFDNNDAIKIDSIEMNLSTTICTLYPIAMKIKVEKTNESVRQRKRLY